MKIWARPKGKGEIHISQTVEGADEPEAAIAVVRKTHGLEPEDIENVSADRYYEKEGYE